MADIVSHLESGGIGGGEIIDDDIQHTVGRLLHIKPQQNNLMRNKKDSLEDMMTRALQAERNHWKERLQTSLHEIDRQHRIILATQSGLQELVKTLRYSRQRNAILEEEESDDEEVDQELVMSRLLEYLKFQIRQMKVRAGFSDTSKAEFEECQIKQKQNIRDLRETVTKMEIERNHLDEELSKKEEKIKWLKKENANLHRQLTKAQAIIERYNETHSGSNFHLKVVEGSRDKRASTSTTLDHHENSISTVRERTYVEGDQLGSYPDPSEENALIKDRLRKNIYSARKGDLRSSNVAMCFRCQALFRPPENNRKACRYHHKGREITEQFDTNGKLDKVVYKWACCKKPLEAPGCCFGYHV